MANRGPKRLTSSLCSISSQCSSRGTLQVPVFLAPSFRKNLPTAITIPTRVICSATSSTRRLPTPSAPVSTRTYASSSRDTPSANPANSNDTIFAQATGSGVSGVCIIRISGPLSSQFYFSLCLTSRTSTPKPYRRLPPSHKLVVRNIHHPHTRELLDAGAGTIYFPHGRSYTGEEGLELHIHGGVATVRDVLDAIGAYNNLSNVDRKEMGKVRPADPGEFTRRAYQNSRLDLASAEALHSLITSETSIQRQVALLGTTGLQTQRYESIRSELLKSMAMIEALIDFGDEDGVEDGTLSSALLCVNSLAALLRSELGLDRTSEARDKSGAEKGVGARRHVGEILTNGIRLAIYGPPNAGKSSLLNWLADRNAAIVSDIPGTTRDVLQVHLDLNGYKVLVSDTAGIRDDSRIEPEASNESNGEGNGSSRVDEIEAIGIERAREAVRESDLSLLVLPADADGMAGRFEMLRPASYAQDDPDLIFYNKVDLLPTTTTIPPPSPPSVPTQRVWRGSVRTGTGMSNLINDLADLIASKYAMTQSEAPLITQTRHRFLLQECLGHIDRFLAIVGAEAGDLDLVLAAEELRYAAKAVGKLTGRDVSPDEILGSIFSTFCIGK